MKLLVIDIQKGITDDRLYNYHSFISNVKTLIDAARANNVEVIYFQHDDGPGTGFSIGDDEFEIAKEVYPINNEKRYVKMANSCFSNKEFVNYLNVSNEDTLMIVGLQTNFCIDATVKSAFDNGYKIIIPKECNSTFDNEYMDKETTYRYYNDMMWPDRFGNSISVSDAKKLIEFAK